MAQAVSDNRNKKKKKKRRSQAPVALVYFATLLIFLGVVGVIAGIIVTKLTNNEEETVDFSDTYIDSYNTLYVRVDDSNVLGDIALVRVCPEQSKILVVPISAYTVSATDSSSTFSEIYASEGIRPLQEAVDSTFGTATDYYITVSNDSFEYCADVIGGFTYTPSEELYKLSEESTDDISIRANTSVVLTGRQIRLICDYDVFSEGKQGNMEFLGEAVTALINNAFDQIEITTSSLDDIYSKVTSNGNTNLTENDYKQLKVYLKDMLEQQIQPAYSMIPEGQWTDESHFELSAEFKQKLYDELEATKSQENSVDVSEE